MKGPDGVPRSGNFGFPWPQDSGNLGCQPPGTLYLRGRTNYELEMKRLEDEAEMTGWNGKIEMKGWNETIEMERLEDKAKTKIGMKGMKWEDWKIKRK